ncbi:alanyl-tRNA synthetase [Thecamonas trahens ATCC 50062]|uniref:Alanine--tRNA ligase n=1 Tax=Thecamonas trahens ATCC 50062 TaxID=461836 RepID=A0A0L0DWJ0_THETB|nr:alanyl-tRNA synthetase [Thecamonas trahens ATCC 50062]KNC56456.1 alanyl-tRNA synthetase [Thecamonas trahens ATCC 50062]|eukprot:XP_013760966.1 alanyl-tRNA synthetase [Thecamonas trahens ATCC 50062]
MLGNFAFDGALLKQDAIDLAWRFLTHDLALPRDRLAVSVHVDDARAYAHWTKSIGLPPDRVFKLGDADNYWAMGEVGPCGPCTEMFWIPDPLVGKPLDSLDECLELWNVVFMEDEVRADGVRAKLPAPAVDTGMGLERLASVVQGVSSNYATDAFAQPIAAMLASVPSLATVNYSVDSAAADSIAVRVVADHLRCLSYLISEGVMPSASSRGYVARRILRRALLHAHTALDLHDPCLPALAAPFVASLADSMPRVAAATDTIIRTLEAEEHLFRATLDRGLARFAAAVRHTDALSGADAFQLYDTYGFPIDLTTMLAADAGVTVDVAGFHAALQASREASRTVAGAAAEPAWEAAAAESALLAQLGAQPPATQFVGYDDLAVTAAPVAACWSPPSAPHRAYVVVAASPLYREAGGQVSDSGVLVTPTGQELVVCQLLPLARAPSTAVVVVESKGGESIALAPGDAVDVAVDAAARARTAAHHSATHLLHAALRAELGESVAQAGSRVEPARLRFDFSVEPGKAITPELLRSVEASVNAAAAADLPVETRETTYADAVERGALALFGEKYDPSSVRMVSMGDASTELCGGTHVASTAALAPFVVLGERGIGAGVRRVEALAGPAAADYLVAQHAELRAAAAVRGIAPTASAVAASALKTLRKQQRKTGPASKSVGLVPIAELSAGALAVYSVTRETLGLAPDASGKALRIALQDTGRALVGQASAVAHHVLVCPDDGVVAVAASNGGNAPALLADVLDKVGGGRGGGSPHFAQGKPAGRVDANSIVAALDSDN